MIKIINTNIIKLCYGKKNEELYLKINRFNNKLIGIY